MLGISGGNDNIFPFIIIFSQLKSRPGPTSSNLPWPNIQKCTMIILPYIYSALKQEQRRNCTATTFSFSVLYDHPSLLGGLRSMVPARKPLLFFTSTDVLPTIPQPTNDTHSDPYEDCAVPTKRWYNYLPLCGAYLTLPSFTWPL